MYNPDAVVVVASPMEMFWYNQMMSADMGIFGWVIVMGVIFTIYAILLDKYNFVSFMIIALLSMLMSME